MDRARQQQQRLQLTKGTREGYDDEDDGNATAVTCDQLEPASAGSRISWISHQLDRAAVPWSLGLDASGNTQLCQSCQVSDTEASGRGVIRVGNDPTKSARNDDIGRFRGKTTHPPSKTAESLTKDGD